MKSSETASPRRLWRAALGLSLVAVLGANGVVDSRSAMERMASFAVRPAAPLDVGEEPVVYETSATGARAGKASH